MIYQPHIFGLRPSARFAFRGETFTFDLFRVKVSDLIEAEMLKEMKIDLDWKDVKPLIEKHLGDLKIPIVVYSTYHSGVQATEKL